MLGGLDNPRIAILRILPANYLAMQLTEIISSFELRIVA
jgi:hypothetical protein